MSTIKDIILDGTSYSFSDPIAKKKRVAIPANEVIDFPGDGEYYYNPMGINKAGDQKVWFYDASGEPITITKDDTGNIANQSDGALRITYGGNGTAALSISGTSLAIVTAVNANTMDKYWSYAKTRSYYTLASVPVSMKINQDFVLDIVNFDAKITKEFTSEITDTDILEGITGYVNDHSLIVSLFDITPVRLKLYTPYPIKDGVYFPNPITSSTEAVRVVFWDADMNVILPPSDIFTVKTNYSEMQRRDCFEISGNKVRKYEDWYAHNDPPAYPIPKSKQPTEWYTFETTPAYVSLNGTYNYVASTDEFVDDNANFVSLKTEENYDLVKDIAENSLDYTFESLNDNLEYGRRLKSEMIYAINKNRHAIRLGTFNIATKIRDHWYKLKECLEEYGIDICGLQEVRYPLQEQGLATLVDYFTGWAFPYVSDNGDAYRHGDTNEGLNERNLLSRIPIDSTVEYELTMGTDYRYVAKSVLSLPQYMNKRGSENLKLSVYNFQLEVSGTMAQTNADEVLEIVAEDDNPFIILMGDTNDFSIDKVVWQKFANAGFTPVVSTNTATVSGTYDYNCIDNFFISSRISAINYDVIWSQRYPYIGTSGYVDQLSDHDLVIADVVLDYSDIRCVNYHLTNVTASAANNRTWLSDTETLTITLTPASGYSLGTISVLDGDRNNTAAYTISGNTITLTGSQLKSDVLITCSGVSS